MKDKKKGNPKGMLTVAVGLVVLALLAYFIWIVFEQRQFETVFEKEAQTETTSERPSTPTLEHQEEKNVVPMGESTPVPEGVVSDENSPQCAAEGDCDGPRLAECIEMTCDQGRCIYDKSHCECTSADDCEDNDPCTRNHCFARTLKCIYIPEGCEQK